MQVIQKREGAQKHTGMLQQTLLGDMCYVRQENAKQRKMECPRLVHGRLGRSAIEKREEGPE